jgi:hypothetical protein
VVQEALERAIQDPPRSLMAICKQIGYRNLSSLYHRFPELCRELVAKNGACRDKKDQWVRELITKALDEGHVPTLKELARRLSYHPTSCAGAFQSFARLWLLGDLNASTLSESVFGNNRKMP